MSLFVPDLTWEQGGALGRLGIGRLGIRKLPIGRLGT